MLNAMCAATDCESYNVRRVKATGVFTQNEATNKSPASQNSTPSQPVCTTGGHEIDRDGGSSRLGARAESLA